MLAGAALTLLSGFWLIHRASEGFAAGFVLHYAPTPLLLIVMEYADATTGQEAAKLILSRLAAGNLSQGQLETFVDRLIRFEFEVRPRVAVGADLPAHVRILTRFENVTGFQISAQELQIDRSARPVSSGVMGVASASGEAGWGTYFPTTDVAPGSHRVEVLVSFSLMSGSSGVALGSVSRRLSGTFETTTSDSGVGLRSSPELDDAVRNGVRLRNLVSGDGWRPPRPSGIGFSLEFLPGQRIGQCYDVFVEVAGREIDGNCTVYVAKDNRTQAGVFQHIDLATKAPERVSIILRRNPTGAARTVDLTEIWDGEIRFDDVSPRSTSGSVPASDSVYTPTSVKRVPPANDGK